MGSMPLMRPRRQCQALALGRCCDILRDPLPRMISRNYLTVILHRDIGFPFPADLPSHHKVLRYGKESGLLDGQPQIHCP